MYFFRLRTRYTILKRSLSNLWSSWRFFYSFKMWGISKINFGIIFFCNNNNVVFILSFQNKSKIHSTNLKAFLCSFWWGRMGGKFEISKILHKRMCNLKIEPTEPMMIIFNFWMVLKLGIIIIENIFSTFFQMWMYLNTRENRWGFVCLDYWKYGLKNMKVNVNSGSCFFRRISRTYFQFM